MSQADVELVRALVPPPETDWAASVRDESRLREIEESSRALFAPDFPCSMLSVADTQLQGFEGLWTIWREWLEPWAEYHVFEEEIVDLGEGKVLWLGRDVGQSKSGAGRVTLHSSAIWSVSDGLISEVVFYPQRSTALAAAGIDR
jgi:hypothetical protein